jgi:sec-independent protein translocase protein TatB
MFEIGFSEILLIFVIALVVLGPERLPKLAAQVGRWAGRAKSMARQFREQLESEVDLEAALTPKPAPKKATPAEPEAPAATTAPDPSTAGVPYDADDYSAAHDPASSAYVTPADQPVPDRSEEPPAISPAVDPDAPPVQVDAFGTGSRDELRG